jgi:hypothetical protein
LFSLSLSIASFIEQFLDNNFYTLKLGSFALALVTFLLQVNCALASFISFCAPKIVSSNEPFFDKNIRTLTHSSSTLDRAIRHAMSFASFFFIDAFTSFTTSLVLSLALDHQLH